MSRSRYNLYINDAPELCKLASIEDVVGITISVSSISFMKTLIMVFPASRDMCIFDVYFAREGELQGVSLNLSYLAPSSLGSQCVNSASF